MSNRLPLSIASAAVFLCLGGTERVQAYLGSFEEQDGYHTPVTVTGYLDIGGKGEIPSLGIVGDATFYNGDPSNGFISWVPPAATPNSAGDTTHGPDVTRYNAGGFGISNGGPGGVGVDIQDNSGLWQALQGGRLNDDANAPSFNGSVIQGRDHIIAWRYPNPHDGAQVLDVLASEVDLTYKYSLDSRDLNGLAPSASSEYRTGMSFWFCPTDSDDGYVDNVLGLGVKDVTGQKLIEIGWTGSNQLQYRVGGSSLWQTTSVNLGTHGWSQATITVDAFNNTASLSALAWDDNTGTLSSHTLLTDVALGLNAASLDSLQWTAKGGILDPNFGAVAYKNTFDDFQFNAVAVPESGGAWLVAIGALAVSRRRRK
ncbi:MAG: hypothetical protein K1X78_11440 [Verrucomicrobiaceae bacterium]|nr:hypothetical protein [Verrucomicrobiaceae bacterium]